jgi:uracil-DNA glycosylase family 4
VLVGEGPGRDEAEVGRPFIGATGIELDAALQRVGLLRTRLAVLNATKCKPPEGAGIGDKNAALRACRGHFEKVYETLRQLPTLAMGKLAWAAVSGKAGSIETGRGFVREKLIVTWHPTYAFFRNPWEGGNFEVDLRRFARLIAGTVEKAPVLDTSPSVATIKRFNSFPWVACDIETTPCSEGEPWTGKDPTRARLRTIQFGRPMFGAAFHVNRANVSQVREAKRVFANPRVAKVWCNGVWFDLRVLSRAGLDSVNNVDVRDMRRSVSTTSRLSLRYLTSIYSDFPAWKESEDEK